MSTQPSDLTFTPLVESTDNVTQNPPAAPFDAAMAYLLGQCCSLTYAQFDQGTIATSDFSSLIYQDYTVSASNLLGFTVSEANEPGPTTNDIGDYYQAQAGFGVQLTLTATDGSTEDIIVIALRGTRTWEEWFDDADAMPTPFAGSFLDAGLGSVHGGFYSIYTMGTNGATVTSGEELSPTVDQRAGGSIASQVGQYVSGLDGQLPIYVTGHSLGGALATLCALDIAYNFPSNIGIESDSDSNEYVGLYMYSLASPRVAVGLSSLPLVGNQQLFLTSYQTLVPNSYQIVNAADIMPTLPPLSTSLGMLTLTCAQVTDPYQMSGSGATATASVDNGNVTSIIVGDSGVFYPIESTFPVIISGDVGVGAVAVANVDAATLISDVTVIFGGSDYTSAPNVVFPSSGSLTQNVINFCAQTGDIGQNHSCTNTYVPYLAQLAEGFA